MAARSCAGSGMQEEEEEEEEGLFKAGGESERGGANIYIYIHMHAYVYMHMCVCVCIYIYIYHPISNSPALKLSSGAEISRQGSMRERDEGGGSTPGVDLEMKLT